MNAPVNPGFRVAASMDAAEAVLAESYLAPLHRDVHEGVGLQVWYRGNALLDREPMPGHGTVIWIPDHGGEAVGPAGYPELPGALSRCNRVLLSEGAPTAATLADVIGFARYGGTVVFIEARPDELPEWRQIVLRHADKAVFATSDPDSDVLAIAQAHYDKVWRNYQQGVPGAGELVPGARDALNKAQSKQSSK